MWIGKIKFKDPKCFWATRCKKFNVYNYQYPLSFYMKDRIGISVIYNVLEGEDKNIKKYINSVKEDKKIKKCDTKKNFMITLVEIRRIDEELLTFKAIYNPKLIFIKPNINLPDGYEISEIGSFDREDITTLFKLTEKHFNGKLLSLKNVNIPRIFIPSIAPKMTEKQIATFKLAFSEGYYDFPRKTNLHKLAKITKISRPTFEEHLRKAENKLLSFMKDFIRK